MDPTVSLIRVVIALAIALYFLERYFNLSGWVKRFLQSRSAQNWPLVEAKIEVACGVERLVEERSGRIGERDVIRYVGVLNYFYKYEQPFSGLEVTGRRAHATGPLTTLANLEPEPVNALRMGEYERFFDSLSQAELWARQFKGVTVMIYVNPSDPDESILLDKDLPQVAGSNLNF
jgi:hypothetical protein